MQDTEAKQKLTELINDAKIGMLTTLASDGAYHSRPMGLQKTEFDGDLWFFTYDSSNKVEEVQAQPQVNVAFSSSGNAWVSLSGTAEVIHDQAKAEELWSPLLKAWFPEGLETEGLTLLKVHADSGEYWDAPNSKAIQLFGMAKAAITGEPPKAGDNTTIEL